MPNSFPFFKPFIYEDLFFQAKKHCVEINSVDYSMHINIH